MHPEAREVKDFKAAFNPKENARDVRESASVISGANNHRYAIIPTKGYVTKNWSWSFVT